jgi:hypothetical protein
VLAPYLLTDTQYSLLNFFLMKMRTLGAVHEMSHCKKHDKNSIQLLKMEDAKNRPSTDLFQRLQKCVFVK